MRYGGIDSEPILRPEDRDLWEMWRRIALLRAKTAAHRRAVQRGCDAVQEAVARYGNIAVMWSGGKDSTAMVHLVRIRCGLDLPVISEKDDLDYPGEDEYVADLAERWRLDLTIVRPAHSLLEHVQSIAVWGDITSDIHGRSASLSREHFYPLVESASEGFRCIMLGLRSEESRGRKLNRMTRGLLYEKKSGQATCQPLADWSGLDVMAYMASSGIEPLPLYRCIAFDPEHAAEPWRVRKAWWLPGATTANGGVAWLRHYYPSLYAKLWDIYPSASRFR